jgi:hypothetical protein
VLTVVNYGAYSKRRRTGGPISKHTGLEQKLGHKETGEGQQQTGALFSFVLAIS